MASIGYLKRGVDSIRRKGLLGSSRNAIRILKRAIVEKLGPQKPWVTRQHAIDESFDASLGVDTGGIISLRSLEIQSANYQHGMRYVAVDPDEFQRVVSGLGIQYERFAFVDLGSGKGRSLLLAARLPFRRIIGVEFAHELHTAAQANIDRVKSTLPNCSSIELFCKDAAQFEFPNCPLVVYLYNPFGLEVMRMVAARLLHSFKTCPRDIYVTYLNPFQEVAWTELGFVAMNRGNMYSVLRPPSAAWNAFT